MLVHCCSIETMSGDAPTVMQKMIDTKEGVTKCSRCESTHDTLEWKALSNPVVSAPEGAVPCAVIGYAMCPFTNEPIFLIAWDTGD